MPFHNILTFQRTPHLLSPKCLQQAAGEFYCRCSHHLRAQVGEIPKNLLRSFEGSDFLVGFTKCCGAHEPLDSRLSGSVVRDVTERGVRIDCPLTAAKTPSVCHPLLIICVFQPVVQPICGDKVTWLIKRSKGCWKGQDTANTSGFDMCSCFEREKGQVWQNREAQAEAPRLAARAQPQGEELLGRGEGGKW